jgi:hypothetical protein
VRRIVALAILSVLAYLVWRGYEQPELIFELGNLRMC